MGDYSQCSNATTTFECFYCSLCDEFALAYVTSKTNQFNPSFDFCDPMDLLNKYNYIKHVLTL